MPGLHRICEQENNSISRGDCVISSEHFDVRYDAPCSASAEGGLVLADGSCAGKSGGLEMVKFLVGGLGLCDKD
jgi:hypothetical protein